MPKILVVDDDPHIRELIMHFLKARAFEVFAAVDGLDALSIIESNKVDLVVLDIMMPRMDGWDFCKKIKGRFDIPVLMLTAKAEISQKLKGFELGTDDYLVKPFEPTEMLARVRALLKRYKIESSQKVAIGKLSLDRSTFLVSVGDLQVTLPLKEFELLFKLASYAGKTFSRDQLIQDIWGMDFDGTERTVDVHINRIRERFPEEEYQYQIRTIRGLGYRLETSKS